MKNKISVVMATYNGEAYIKQQLDSIVNQTILPDEIIIIDDRSTDNTLKILKEYANIYPFIKIIYNKCNLGVNKNFEKGIRNSTGDIIFISDQDDIWMSRKIEKFIFEINKNPEYDLYYSDAEVIDKNNKTIEKSELQHHRVIGITGKNLLAVLYKNIVSGHNIAMRRFFFQEAVPFPEGMMYDHWLALFASSKRGLFLINDTTCKHRIHDSNTQNNNKKIIKRNYKNLYILYNFIKNKRKKKILKEVIERLINLNKEDEIIHSHLVCMLRYIYKYNLTYFDKNYFSTLNRDKETIFYSQLYNSNKEMDTFIKKMPRGGLYYIIHII